MARAPKTKTKTKTKAKAKQRTSASPASTVPASLAGNGNDDDALAALDATKPLPVPTHHDRARLYEEKTGKPRTVRVLVIDVGGTHVKVLATLHTGRRAAPSGPELTPAKMVKAVKDLTAGWAYDVVSMGYPGPVARGRIAAEPAHLGKGWVGFDFEKAFNCPIRIINDAAMQALGSYQGGNMLFLGLGTGLGSALVAAGHLHPLELAHLPYRKGRSYEWFLGKRGLKRDGKKAWRKHVADVVGRFLGALQVDELVLGGGNATHLKQLPPKSRLGDNANAFKGGFRLWGPPAPRDKPLP